MSTIPDHPSIITSVPFNEGAALFTACKLIADAYRVELGELELRSAGCLTTKVGRRQRLSNTQADKLTALRRVRAALALVEKGHEP